MSKNKLDKKEKILEMLAPFAEQAKFNGNGPGYLRKEDWKKLDKVYMELKRG